MTARAQFNNLTIWQLSILIAYNQATLPFLKIYFDFPGMSSNTDICVLKCILIAISYYEITLQKNRFID